MKYTYFSSQYKLNIKLKNISSYNDSIPIRKNNIKSYDTIINSIPMLTNKFCYINEFDQIYLPKWFDNKLDKKENSIKGSNNKELLFAPENIKLNYLIYNYYGPNETKFNFILN